VVAPRGPVRWGSTFALLVSIYFVAGKLGLTLAFVNASATAVWPPTGLAIAALLLLGIEFWPAILVGAFAVNVTTSGDLPSSVGIAVGNTLEAVIATRLVDRWAGGRTAFERSQHVLRFALLAAVLATAVSATIGVTSLVVTGLARLSDFGPIWLTWWLGDASGALLITPALVLWATSRLPSSSKRWGEAMLLALAAVATGLLVFGGRVPFSIERYPIGFLSFPVLVWAAFRFGPSGAATVGLTIGAIAVWGTLNGFGPYALKSPNESLLLLQGFMAVAAVTSLTLAAAVFDRVRTEARLLAVEQRSRVIAEEAARAREDFLSIATHELRTPVASLSGYAQLAERAVVAAQTERIAPALQSIVRQSARLSALITQLLDAAHIQNGQLDIESHPNDLSALTAETVEAARLIDAERHRWEVRIDPAIHADVDALRWGQAVRNLLDNAAKYSPAEKTISVRLRRDGKGPISLEVADDGIGIAAARVGHVFDRFYRAHADDSIGGLGLGLFIAREVVERHGGRMDVSSVEGRGTTFKVTLPATRATAPVETSASLAVGPRPDSLARRRILVVDDEPDVRALVEIVLSDAGHTVIGAKDGQDALALTARDRPDLILLDKLMPTMDGTAFARAYRDATADPAPIVAFCAARDAENWATSIGAVAHLGKPFDVDDLDRVVRKQLEALSRRPSRKGTTGPKP
jgi:signal transduction histidine kinase/ActR/RegA family two-component response regulator